MKNVNGYYRFMYRRRNAFKENLLALFFSLSSWPRLLLEVFIRRNMGERYFTLSGSIMLVLLLALYPVLKVAGIHLFSWFGYYRYQFDFLEFTGHYLTWYAFLAAFLYTAFQRHEEVKRLPGVFELARFSLSSGLIHPRFLTFEIGGKRADYRTIETLLEPSFFFGVGIVLWSLSQSLGPLLVLCSVIYSLSYVAAYNQADNYLMDLMDKLIADREVGRSFIDCLDPEETSGFRVMGRYPADPETRRLMVDMSMRDENVFEAV